LRKYAHIGFVLFAFREEKKQSGAVPPEQAIAVNSWSRCAWVWGGVCVEADAQSQREFKDPGQWHRGPG